MFLDVDNVLVESQPLKARENIKGIGHAIFDYYVLRGTIDHKKYYNDIKFIDARNKLTIYNGPPITCHPKTPYARNKWYSIKYCQWILNAGNVLSGKGLLDYFEHHGKKDDLADCFLQGLWYLGYGKTQGDPDKLANTGAGRLIYREHNRAKYKKARARAPKTKTGKYTLANIKYLMNRNHDIDDLKSSIEFFFGDIEYFNGVLKNV